MLYTHDGKEFEAYVARPQGEGPRLAVLVFHAWAGRSAFECARADALAQLGFIGIAVDLYGKGLLGRNNQENAELMQPLLDDRLLLRARIRAAYQASLQLEGVSQTAAIGYCFGGLCALDAARINLGVSAVVSFHGNLTPYSATGPIHARILVLHGYQDLLVSQQAVTACMQEFDTHARDWQLHQFGQAEHSFTNPDLQKSPLLYHALSDARSWRLMRQFLLELV